jgi:hypothetical protein
VVIQNLRTVRFHFPRRNFLSGFFWLVQSSDVVNLATVNCFLILSFHIFLSVLFQFVLLLGWVVLIFQRSFSLLAIGLQIFLSLSAAAVSSVELSPVPCLWCLHHHQHSHVFAVQKAVLECDVVFSALAFIRASSFALRSWSVMLEGSGTKEISFPSGGWWSSWFVSAGMFFLDFFVVASWVVYSWNTMGANVGGGIRKSGQDPQTQEKNKH